MKTTTKVRNAHSSNDSKRPDILQTPKAPSCGLKNDALLTIPQAADRLGIAVKTCWNWTYLRKLPVVRLSRGCVRISTAALNEMIAKNTVPALE